MAREKIHDHLLTLFHAGETITGPTPDYPSGYERVANRELAYDVIFKNDNYVSYLNTIKSIYRYSKNVAEKVSYDFLKKMVTEFIASKIQSGSEPERRDSEAFWESISKMETKEYVIIADVFGIVLKNNSIQHKIGNFNFYHWPTVKSDVEKRLNHKPEDLWIGSSHEYMCEVTTHAVDDQKALELAKLSFERVESVLLVIAGTLRSDVRVFIVDPKPIFNQQFTLIAGQSLSQKNSLVNFLTPMVIDDERYFNNPSLPYAAMWPLIVKTSHNELENRITLAIEWLGQAYVDTKLQNKFLKAAISIEIIFAFQENTVITPSITSLISESMALILGPTVEACLKIESDIKELYSMRSAIVHSGSKSIDEDAVSKIVSYSRYLILHLLDSPKFNTVKTIKELFSLLKRMKYQR